MRALCRSLLASLLIVLLVNIPAEAASTRALGFVQIAQSSSLDGIPAVNGTNVVTGDLLATDSNGQLELQFGTNMLYIPGASVVKLASDKNGVVAALTTGSVEFSSPSGNGMAVDAEDILITPKTSQATRAQVTLLAKDELKIAAVAGPLNLEIDGHSYSLDPGKTYGVRIVDEAAPSQYETGRPARQRRGLIILVLASAAVAAAIIFLVKELNESPEVP